MVLGRLRGSWIVDGVRHYRAFAMSQRLFTLPAQNLNSIFLHIVLIFELQRHFFSPYCHHSNCRCRLPLSRVCQEPISLHASCPELEFHIPASILYSFSNSNAIPIRRTSITAFHCMLGSVKTNRTILYAVSRPNMSTASLEHRPVHRTRGKAKFQNKNILCQKAYFASYVWNCIFHISYRPAYPELVGWAEDILQI